MTNPRDPSFIRMLVSETDVSPEGLAAYRMGDAYYLAHSNEVSNTTTVYRLASAATSTPTPQTLALILGGLAGLAIRRIIARRR